MTYVACDDVFPLTPSIPMRFFRGSPMIQKNMDLFEPLNQEDVFHFSEKEISFNKLSIENGNTYWYANDLMKYLGYQSFLSFRNAINKAISICTSLGIDVVNNFTQEFREIDGKKVTDHRLSRFACYLVAMNADTKKIEVARAQAYFSVMAESFRRYVEGSEEFEHLYIRDEVSEHEKSLSASAKNAGVFNHALFQNAGYVGLYNMSLKELKKLKKIPEKCTPLDFMRKEELAANLFRLTQTEAKLKNENIRGQHPSEQAANLVGREVRGAMERISGQRPEELVPGEDIKKSTLGAQIISKGIQKIGQKLIKCTE